MSKELYVIVLWEELIIGNIYSANGQYIYYPNYGDIDMAKEHGMPPLPQVMEPQLNFGELPVFFKERIEHDPKFKNNCRYATDKFRLIPAQSKNIIEKEPA
jgi:hypothetical protein